MNIQFSQLASRAETIVQARPEPSTLPRPDGADVPSSRPPTQATETVTARGLNETAATETRGDFTRGERVDRRTAGRALGAAAEELGVAQAARDTLRRGRDDLAVLDRLARDADARQIEQADAEAVRDRLRRADADPSLVQARRAVESADLERAATEAEAEAQRAAREVLEAPPIPDQTTLTLVPSGIGARERAADAEDAAELARSRATRADVARATLGREPRPVLEPRAADVQSPEAARETRGAVAEADARSRRLDERIAALETRAGDRARQLAEDVAAQATSPRLDSTRDAERTAREVARSTIDAPAQALTTQPFLSVEAALRVLA